MSADGPTAPLKVLFVNENIGGHATVHLHLRGALAKRSDVEATFLDIPPPSGPARLGGARVPGLARLDLDLQPLRAQLIRSAWLRRRLPKPIELFDAVHLYTHNAGLLSATTWRTVPTVVSIDTTNAQNAYRLPSRRPTRFTALTVAATKPFERGVYRAATTIVANSAWAEASLRADYGVADERVRIQPFGLAAPQFTARTAAEPPAGRPQLVFVGRSLDRKGGHQLLRAHRERLSDLVDLVLVTEERVETQPGVKVINDLVPGDGRLWDILRQASLFVFPSEIDMAPNAIIEAMMAGLPVVARPVGAIPEMVEHEVNGLLVGPSDDELAEAVRHLIDHPEKRQRMAAASRQRALDYYDADRTTDALIAILREAVCRHRRTSQAKSNSSIPMNRER